MKRVLVGMVVLVAVVSASGRAEAWQGNHCGPWAQTAAFPSANPPGWYTNTYSFAWQYPWFAYYNYSHGPYANWMAGGGYGYYASFAGAPPVYPGWTTPLPAPKPKAEPKDGATPKATPKAEPKDGAAPHAAAKPAAISVKLPPDATLLFNPATLPGSGAVRTFTTGPLQLPPGR